MLDKICLDLLKFIGAECGDEEYKIFSYAEISTAVFPKKQDDKAVLSIKKAIKTLEEQGYISIKYSDETEVCLYPLIPVRRVFERIAETRIDDEKSRKKYFKYSFWGSVLGGIAVCAVMVTLTVFGVV